jgi:hypothetical protein
MVFTTNVRTIRKYLLKGVQDPNLPGRHDDGHLAFSEECEKIILEKLKNEYESNRAFTRKQLLSYVASTFDNSVTKGWVNSFIGRHLDELKVCQSFPQEDTRFLIPRDYLKQHIVNMQTYVRGKTAELVFNLDEVGSSDWEDRKSRKVVVPAKVDSDNVFHPVPRRLKHMTILVCVSAGGDTLCPMLIVAQSVPDDLWSNGLRPDEVVRRNDSQTRAHLHGRTTLL